MGRKRSDDAAYTFELVDDDADPVVTPQAVPTGDASQSPVPDAGGSPGSTTAASAPAEPAGGVLTFDLVVDADGEGEVVAGGSGTSGPEDRAGVRETPLAALTEPVRLAARDLGSWVGRHRRIVVPAAVAVVVVALVGGGIATVQERQRFEQLASAPGGVGSLLEAPEQVWELEESSLAVAVLDGALVLQDHDELVAVEPGTGEVRWRTELAYAECGETGYGPYGQQLPAYAELMCLAGQGPERDLVVVGSDGEVTSRASVGGVADGADDDPGSGREPRLWQGHGVVRAARVGPALEREPVELDCDETGGACTAPPGVVLEGRDLAVSLVDATGETAWETVIPFELDDDPGTVDTNCIGYASVEEFAPDEFWVSVSGEAVQVDGCGAQGLITADGELQRGDMYSMPQLVSLPGGELVDVMVRPTDDPDAMSVTSIVRSPDGTTLAEVDGFPLVPTASDGLPGVTLVGGDTGVRALGSDWAELWSSPVQTWQLLAQAGGVAVVHGQQEALTALDLDTGEDAWRWTAPAEVELPDGTTRYLGEPYAVTAFTDGRVLMVVYSLVEGGAGGPGLVAYGLDLRSGDVVWTETYPGLRELRAVGGRLVGTDVFGLAGLG
ncbi:PQQ-binding-like beta-propeller repeat protein [Antribacter gilvus]|uniref:outer membrane protein assembly factor BamB family protein n=1 Tax=Antribacter gilvus TaxID=2304675 RepID=UPI0013DF24A5|nr:PQQ-binding-like beta-propeller repeat protein [Antribacter gilvus]